MTNIIERRDKPSMFNNIKNKSKSNITTINSLLIWFLVEKTQLHYIVIQSTILICEIVIRKCFCM